MHRCTSEYSDKMLDYGGFTCPHVRSDGAAETKGSPGYFLSLLQKCIKSPTVTLMHSGESSFS